MPDSIQLVIVTPERQLLSHRVVEVTLPGADGELGVLPGHAPLITELGIGELRYRGESTILPQTGAAKETIAKEFDPDFQDWVPRMAIIRGFAEVLGDRVTVLAETAERAEEIDTERAKAALDRAEKRIAGGPAAQDIDWDRATAALQRALVRIKVAEYAPKKRGVAVPGQ
ncbi:MAG TPA: ATP synthase delta/epsilon chain alpha-helix domain-containing protein [Candidatus Acidoferrum sp.]|nr:ATP synthase delta/epsilon chain alpha-helix domain-containing protein [Candidatus Acidoferrum sp.]